MDLQLTESGDGNWRATLYVTGTAWEPTAWSAVQRATFYALPREHWKHLRTSNPVESPFAAVRLRTAAAKRFKKVENATAVIWKTLLIAEKTFRRLDAPELLADIASGLVYINGVRVVNRGDKKVAA